MSTKTSTNKNDNKREDDELEDEFLNCDIDSFPSPNEKLENYQFELREIMKSGCNLQIAEYSLLQCNIFSHLDSDKKNYDKKLGPILVEMEKRIEIYKSKEKDNNQKKNDEKNKNDDNQNQTENEEEEEEDQNKEYKYYEEEIDAIMEKHAEELEKYSQMAQMELDKIKKDWMKIFYELVEESVNKESFKEAKKNYNEKRTSLIDSALRLVKKIVNDDDEYKKFYKNYFGKEYEG